MSNVTGKANQYTCVIGRKVTYILLTSCNRAKALCAYPTLLTTRFSLFSFINSGQRFIELVFDFKFLI